MKRGFCCLLLAVLLWTLAGQAVAGDFYEIIIAADGKGAAVYTGARAEKKAGLLYNGYWDVDVDWHREKDGYYPLRLTKDYTVWVHEKTASKNLPANYWEQPDWEKQAPCDAFLGRLIQHNGPLYSRPDSSDPPVARHAIGSLFVVWGEFGAYDYVGCPGGGFIPKSAIESVAKLTYEAANYNGIPFEERTVYAGDACCVPVSDSAVGVSQVPRRVVRDGATVNVITYLPDGWAQLEDGAFIETRFLQETGDHTWQSWATVKTSSVLSRLNVRDSAGADAYSKAKLCAGVRVQVVSRTEDWAVICLTGTKDSEAVLGCVMTQYLEFGDSAKVKSGMTEAYLDGDATAWFGKRTLLPAGTPVTVLGVSPGFDADAEADADQFLVRTEDGRVLWILNENGLLRPTGSTGVTAKTSSSVKLRETPLKSAPVIQSLGKGTKVEVLLRGEGWTLVRYKERTGYIMSRYLNFP